MTRDIWQGGEKCSEEGTLIRDGSVEGGAVERAGERGEEAEQRLVILPGLFLPAVFETEASFSPSDLRCVPGTAAPSHSTPAAQPGPSGGPASAAFECHATLHQHCAPDDG